MLCTKMWKWIFLKGQFKNGKTPKLKLFYDFFANILNQFWVSVNFCSISYQSLLLRFRCPSLSLAL